MPENLPAGFKQEVLEAEIKRLSAEIEKYKELPEARIVSGQEIVKRSIQSAVPAQQATVVQKQSGDLPDYTADAPAETKLEIEYLVSMAMNQGIDKAVGEASKSSPFVMDALHDALAAKLYPELQKRGMIK